MSERDGLPYRNDDDQPIFSPADAVHLEQETSGTSTTEKPAISFRTRRTF